MKMKALVQYAPYDNRLEEVNIPEITEDEMLLKVHGCGICAGDLKAYHGGIRIWGSDESNRYIEPPVIGGHEFFGEIVEKGKNIKDFSTEDVVAIEQIVPCGHCRFCRSGKYWMCEKSAVYGFKQAIHGGFAEYVKIHPNSLVHKIPSSFSFDQSVLIEPMACGMHAVELAHIKHDDIVVIAGMGAIGTAMVSMAQLYLPNMIIGLDVKPFRLELGKKFGARYALNPLDGELIEKINKLTDGHGCDVYIEASGSPASVTQGFSLLCNHGRYIQMGVFAAPVSADWNIIGDGKELNIQGSHLSALTFKSVIDGIDKGLLETEGLVSHHFRLEEWEKAFEVADKAPDAMKVVLVP
ncbi:MAG: alcohol dehydrogenase catalytic domain-containing protein [Sphaerochaetaceae bacterium]